MHCIRRHLLLLLAACLIAPAAQADRPDRGRERDTHSSRAGEARERERPRYHGPGREADRGSGRSGERGREQRWQQERQRFREATPEERARMRERFESRLGEPSLVDEPRREAPREPRRPVGEEEGRALRQRLERMPEPERERIRDNAERFQSLSPEDRERLRGALRHLRELSPEERRRTLERLLEE